MTTHVETLDQMAKFMQAWPLKDGEEPTSGDVWAIHWLKAKEELELALAAERQARQAAEAQTAILVAALGMVDYDTVGACPWCHSDTGHFESCPRQAALANPSPRADETIAQLIVETLQKLTNGQGSINLSAEWDSALGEPHFGVFSYLERDGLTAQRTNLTVEQMRQWIAGAVRALDAPPAAVEEVTKT